MRILEKIKGNNLIKNTIILSVAGILVGGINYVTHPILARVMDVKTYGEFEALFAILYIGSVPAATIMTVIKKQVSAYLSKNETTKIIKLIKLTYKYVSIFSVIFTMSLILTSHKISSFLQIESITPIILLAFSLVFSFLLAINNGTLHGFQKFVAFSCNNIVGAISKGFFITILVIAGFALNGATTGLVLSGTLVLIYSLWQIKFIFGKNNNVKESSDINLKQLAKYSIPTFFILLFLNLLYNLDIILIKHFFSPEKSGLYAAITVIGRLIFFITGSITLAMFPMTSYAHEKNGGSKKILVNSLLLLLTISGGFILAFFLLPEIIVKLLIGPKFTGEISQYLGWFSIAMTALSVLNLLIQYLLSIGKTNCVYFLSLGPIALGTLIYLFHESIWQIIWIMNSVLGCLTLGLGLYTLVSIKPSFKSPVSQIPSTL